MDETIGVSLQRIKEIIDAIGSKRFSTVDILREYSGGFFWIKVLQPIILLTHNSENYYSVMRINLVLEKLEQTAQLRMIMVMWPAHLNGNDALNNSLNR